MFEVSTCRSKTVRTRTPLIATLAMVVFATVLCVPSIYAQDDQRCFVETNQCISGRIRQFWEQNGGLPVFGYPIGPQQDQVIEGVSVQAQNFERNRLELHPENARPYDVLLGRLGADRLAQLGKDWHTYPQSGAQDGCRYFPETNQSVCGTILRAWRASGLELDGRAGKTESESLALFGLPLSPLVTEVQSDGVERQVQWFERARFEIHPENQPPYDVLLGLLGNELRDNGGGQPAPQPQPPAPAPTAITLTGNGSKVTDAVTLPTQITRVRSSYRGDRNFIVWAYEVDRDNRELVANTIGDYDGIRPLVSTRPVYFEVTASGDWSLTIEPLPQEQNASTGLSGHGDYVSGTFQPPRKGAVPFRFSHDGSSNFIVWVLVVVRRPT